MNFHLYPHDTQQCAMKIESRKWLFFFFFQDDSVSTPIFHGSEFSYSFVFVRPSCKSGDVSLQTGRAAPPFPTCSRISTSHWVNLKTNFVFHFCWGNKVFCGKEGKVAGVGLFTSSFRYYFSLSGSESRQRSLITTTDVCAMCLPFFPFYSSSYSFVFHSFAHDRRPRLRLGTEDAAGRRRPDRTAPTGLGQHRHRRLHPSLLHRYS